HRNDQPLRVERHGHAQVHLTVAGVVLAVQPGVQIAELAERRDRRRGNDRQRRHPEGAPPRFDRLEVHLDPRGHGRRGRDSCPAGGGSYSASGERSAAAGCWLAASTSSLRTRPSRPVPTTWSKATPCSAATRSTTGE